MAVFATLVFVPKALSLPLEYHYVGFGAAIVLALLATRIRCENCETLLYKYMRHGLPLGTIAMLEKRCPICSLERH